MLLSSNFRLDLAGFSTALPTPFNAAGAIDLPAFEANCQRQIACGASSLVVCSVTGEMPTLTPSEYRSLLHTAVKVARGRVAVIASVASNATAVAIDCARDAARLGVDGSSASRPITTSRRRLVLRRMYGQSPRQRTCRSCYMMSPRVASSGSAMRR